MIMFFFNLVVERTLEPSVPTLGSTHCEWVLFFGGLFPLVMNLLLLGKIHIVDVFFCAHFLEVCLLAGCFEGCCAC